jgi:hypothetical protein
MANVRQEDLLKTPPKIINLDTVGGNLTKKLHMVLTHDVRRESAVDDMVVCLLEALGFGKGNWVVTYLFDTTN